MGATEGQIKKAAWWITWLAALVFIGHWALGGGGNS